MIMENDCGMNNCYYFFLAVRGDTLEEKDNIGYIVGPVLAVILVIGIVATGCWYVFQNFTKTLNGGI